MRQAIFLYLFFNFAGEANGQNTFNLRERYDFLACTLTNIIPTDSCYYALGIIADTLFPYRTGTIFMKLGLDGEPLSVKTLKSTEKTYESWYNGFKRVEENGFITTAHTIDSTVKTMLIKFDKFGDTIFTKEYFNPHFPNSSFIKPWGGLHAYPDGGYIILNNITSLNMDPDIYLIRTDSIGNQIWGKIFGSTKWDRSESIVTTPDGKIVAGGIRTNQTTNTQDYTFQCHIFQVDSAGNQEWAYLSPTSAGLRDAANDMLLLDDGSIVVASGIGHEQQRSSVNEVYFDRYIFKLDPQHQVEWELTFKDPELNIQTRTTNLVNLSDGSGYILAGMSYNPPQQPPYNEPTKGWLAKISTEGDSLWTRKYAYLPDFPLQHAVYDMKETPDGGLVLCGQSFDWDANANYPQQGWLLKLDEHGCLVPGCHLADAIEEEKAAAIKLAIYPNPTTDYLNFYLKNAPQGKEASFRIVDANGRAVSGFNGSAANTTFIVPVWDWPAGVYFLQYLEGGEVRCTERFFKG